MLVLVAAGTRTETPLDPTGGHQWSTTLPPMNHRWTTGGPSMPAPLFAMAFDGPPVAIDGKENRENGLRA